MIFGRSKAAVRDRQRSAEIETGRGLASLLWLPSLKTGLVLVGVAGGWLGSASVLKLPIEAVLANEVDTEVLLNAAGGPHIAQRLPENTPYAMFFSTQDESLAALEQFELFAKIANSTGEIENPLTLPFLPLGFGAVYEGAPWAGEQSAIAILPETAPRRISPTDLNSKLYGISQIADAEEFANFVKAVETARAEAPEKTTYQEATLWVWSSRSESFSETESDIGYAVPGLTIAQFEGHAVVAPESQTVKDVIEYQRRTSSLADNGLFLRSQYTQQPDALFHLFANLSETSKFNFSNVFSNAGQFPKLPLPRELPRLPSLPAAPDIFSVESRLLASRLTKGATLEAIVYPQAEGLRFQGRLYGNEVFRPVATPELAYANSAIQYVPAPAYTLGGGRNLANFWQRVVVFLSVDETAQSVLEQARFLVSSFTGLDLDTELIGWMDREIAFFSFPSNSGLVNEIFPGAGIEFGLAVQTSDRAKADIALSALSAAARDFVSAEIAVETIVNDRSAINWRIPAEGTEPAFSFLGQSWVSEDTVMFTSGIGSMERILNATAFEPLDEHSTFLNATRSLASPNNGYSYVNAGSSLSLIYGFIEDWFEIEPSDPFFVMAKSYLGTVRSLGGTTSSTEDYWQLDSLINLAPAETPAKKFSLDEMSLDETSLYGIRDLISPPVEGSVEVPVEASPETE